jgi:hypothetical protein
MHQFKLTGMRSQLPQCLNDAVTQPAAPVHGHAGRLVENQQIVIFMDDPGLDSALSRSMRQTGLIPRGQSYGRQPWYIADVQPILGSDPATIETDLARTEDPVDMALGTPFSRVSRKLSIRWPACSESTSIRCTAGDSGSGNHREMIAALTG